ncbi:MAG: DUF1934 domain-containing protein [Acetatifactor sp.]
MTERVLLTISGLQGSEEPASITTADAQYFQRNGSHYLLYEESIEGFSKPFKSRIKLKEKQLELNRQGDVNIRMIFEEGKKHMTNYATPCGELLLEISTKRVQVLEKSEELMVLVEYMMETEEGSLGDYRLKISVRQK